MRVKRFITIIVVIAALAGGGGLLFRRPKLAVADAPTREKILEEIAAADEGIMGLAPDHGGNFIIYKGTKEEEPTAPGDDGFTIGMIDLRNLLRTQLPGTNFVKFFADWSPDDRYFAFTRNYVLLDDSGQSNRFVQRENIGLYDRETGVVKSLTQNAGIRERELNWLGGEEYLVAVLGDGKAGSGFYRGRLGSEQRTRVSGAWNRLAVMTPGMGALSREQQIYGVNLRAAPGDATFWEGGTNGLLRISDFENETVTGIGWLNYSRARSNFVFCTRPRDSNWRYLFRYDPTTRELIQLSFEDTYNGQWLLDGAGYAYVANTNSSFHLAIRTFNGAGNTNLFANGNVILYQVSLDGARVYAVASLGCEPHGIWEYTVTNRFLRQVFNGMGKAFDYAKVVQGRTFNVKASDGVDIPCFLYEPVGQNSSSPAWWRNFERRRKCPGVIHVPATTYQFQRRFEHQAEFFANQGYYFGAVNYRGCDGYGREFSKLADIPKAAEDVLKFREWLIEHTDVDPNWIFLTTTSGGMAVVNELLARQPRSWAGVAVDKPGGMGINLRGQASTLPPHLIIYGGRDGNFDAKALDGIIRWAQTNQVRFRFAVQTNSGHITRSLVYRKEGLKQMADFFAECLK